MLSPINVLQLNIKLGILDILVQSTCFYLFLRYSSIAECLQTQESKDNYKI